MAYSTGTTLLTTVSARTDMSGVIRAAAVLFVAVAIFVLNILIDILYALVDPRIRYS